MASDSVFRRYLVPMEYLLGAMSMAWVGGLCYAAGKSWWCAAALVSAVVCAFMVVKGLLRIDKRLRYVVDATLNGDFSYKFPTENVNRHERETNLMLNRIVAHLEQLSAEVRQKEAFLSQVINLTDIGMVVADEAGNVRFHNESVLRLLERPALTHICQISRQAFSDLSISKTAASLNGRAIQIYTINDLRHPIQSAEVESWEKLTRVLTHEIMNSLTPIRSIAETMKDKATTGDIQEALSTISSSSQSLMTFVKNFRQFTVLPELQMSVGYLKPLLDKCARMGETYKQDGDVSIGVTCFPPDVMVYTDEALLSRVIINIVKNAVEAAASSISIEASVSPDEAVEIRITNDGELITDETAGHIFTPFFTTRRSGSGIGLSLSRRIVTHLGGTLTLKTTPRTCFIIRV